MIGRALLFVFLAAVTPLRGEIRFEEAAGSWGLAFRHHDGGSGRFYLPETYGAGVILLDYDGDGDEDVFFVDGAALPGYAGEAPKSRLFRNEGNVFLDVTDRVGMDFAGYGTGGAAADYDGDGDVDLYVAAFGVNALYENRGDGSFLEVAAERGVADPLWSTSAAFADPDLDGDLDLYVVNYVDFALDHNLACGDPARGIRGYCGPDVYKGIEDSFFRQQGDGLFVESKLDAGLIPANGAGLGLCFGDLDGDGWPDLYVANDTTPNFLFRNLGNGRFEELALLSGTAIGDRGVPEAGMGIDLGDLDGDLLPDIVIGHFEGETDAFYRNMGGALFSDHRYASRLAEPSLRMLTFGVALADLDNDGDLDLAVSNGHIRDNAEAFNPSSAYRQPNQIFENEGSGVFVERRGIGVDLVRSSRGLAAGDLDRDGDLDLVISNVKDQAEVYRNVSREIGNWLQVDLEMESRNRQGLGARVELESGGRRQAREVKSASSYQSQNAVTVHFGLASAEKVERLVVRWPGGGGLELEGLPANRRLLLLRRPQPATSQPETR